MDHVPGKLSNTGSRFIAMAASLVGSAHEVMVIMKSSEADFREYCEGRKELPWAELDRLITLIIRELDLPRGAPICRASRASCC